MKAATLGTHADESWLSLDPLPGEKWDSVPGFDGCYEASDHGRIKSVERYVRCAHGSQRIVRPRILRPAVNKTDKPCKYLYVHLLLNCKGRTIDIHRIVADLFVKKNKPEYDTVVHINHDTMDNNASNLKWTTMSGKSLQQWDIGNAVAVNAGKFGADSNSAKPITMISMDGKEKKEFGSRIQAAQWLMDIGIAREQPVQNVMSAINKAAQGKSGHSYGHKWESKKKTA